MADFTVQARSNYFVCNPVNLGLIEKLFRHDIQVMRKHDTLAAILLTGEATISVETDEQWDLATELGLIFEDDVDLVEILHLALDATARHTLIWMEIGSEKLRYLVGAALRINHMGEVVQRVELTDIYQPGDTRCEY